MWYRSAIVLIFISLGSNLYAQKKLNGIYDTDDHKFICTDPNIIVKPFKNGRAAFMIRGANPNEWKTNRTGFIDTGGNVVCKPVYANCSDFHDNAALAQDTAGNTALIDRNGQTIVPFARQNIQWCTNGLYLITRYSKSPDISIVDVKNTEIVRFGKYSACSVGWPPLYGYEVIDGGDYGGGGSRGFSWNQPQFYRVNFDRYIAVRHGTGSKAKWGVINRDGKEIIPLIFDRIGPFINNLAPFCIDNKCGITDTAYNPVIQPKYDNIELSGNNFAIAILNKKSGVLSLKRKVMVPFKYDRISAIGEGGFLVDTGRPTTYPSHTNTIKFGVLSKTGKIILQVENQSILPFGTGYFVSKNYDSTAVFDSAGIQKTPYASGGYLTYPVCTLGGNQGYLVYNKRKRDFIHYDLVDHFVFKEGGKWGLLDSVGDEVTKSQYEKYWYFPTYLTKYKKIAVFRDKQWNILNEEGKEIASGPYDEIGQEGMSFYKVKKNGKYGLLNIDAKVIVPAIYDRIDVDQYKDHFIIVSLGSKQTYYSFNGRQIMPLKYDLVNPFWDGLGEVMVNKKWGLVNDKGVEVIPCKYDKVISGPLIIVSENNLYGLINRAGKIIMPTVCSSITGGWRVRQPIYILTRDGKTGMVDASGRLFLPFKYDSATSLTYSLKPGGKFLVKNKGLAGVADSTGKIIVPVAYDNVTMLNDTSTHFYWISRSGKLGVAGEDGKVLVPPVFDNVMPFEGTLPQRYKITQNQKEGIADDKGKIIIPCIYTYLSGFGDHPLMAGKDQLFGVIDWKQHTIVPFIYESVQWCNSGFIVRSKGKLGVMDLKGKPIIPIVYNYISCYFKNVFFLTKDNKMGIADEAGKIILPVVYDQLEACGNDNILVTKDKLYGMIDFKGKVIYPCKYTFINCADGKVVEIY